ncbi:MAG: oxidoreductase domain protein [Marmoricola sp.]|nr:oxidoreductase domain protein [Marmoricola sp.]
MSRMDTIRWGVMAPGRIARSFAADLALVPDAELVATGSRSLDRATTFADEFGGAAHGSYEELVADEAVDVVYVASPHPLHAEHTRMALAAGKHVLCEKPMTLDGASTAALFDEAAERGLFLMEAMWMATHPTIRTLRALLTDGEHGTARQVHASIGFVAGPDPTSRLVDPALGGGALLDMGVYPLTFAQLLLGEPDQLTAVANLSDRAIDLDISIAGRYPGGATAALTATLTSHASVTATVSTEIGTFELPRPFYSPDRIRWTSYWTEGGAGEWIEPDEPVVGQGYGNEAMEVHRCLRSGALTSELVPPSQTIALMRQMDDLRAQVGVSYADRVGT